MTQQQLRLPKGSRHSLPIDSIALAVSDRDGIVRWVNNDFAAVSRFKFADLIGRDHQLIRHPATPAGVYREMTEALRHGQSFSAYLDCLAADRSTYPLLTTVLPMGDNYVSIAVSPLLDHYRSQITQVYKAVRPRELERRYFSGESTDDTTDLLDREVGELGYPSYASLMSRALVDEMAARIARRDRGRQPAPGGQLPQHLPDLCVALEAELAAWAEKIGRLRAEVEGLVQTVPALRDVITANVAFVHDLEGQAPVDRPAVSALAYARVWAEMAPDFEPLLDHLARALVGLRDSWSEAEAQIAHAWLYTTVIGRLAVDPGRGRAEAAVMGMLANGLADSIARAQEFLAENRRRAARVSDSAQVLAQMLGMPQTLLENWVTQESADTGRLRQRIQDRLAATQAAMDQLTAAGTRSKVLANQMDGTLLAHQATRVRDCATAA